MKTIIGKKESYYIKMYPSASSIISSNAQQGSSHRKVEETPKEWTGTGFAVNSSCIATNYHVIDGASSIVVKGVNGDFITEYIAQVVASDKVNDLAIIRIIDTRFNGFGQLPYRIVSKRGDVGSDVFVLGYPMSDVMGEEIKLTTGVISSLTGFQGDVSTYQISAPVQPGNSGGPLFNSKGDVIGIVNAGIPSAENVGYAIKTGYLQNLVESIDLELNLPEINQIGELSLPEKVKRLKKSIFLITCKK